MVAVTHPPPGESPHKLLSEHNFLTGIFLMCIAYGAEVIIFLETAYLLLRRRRNMKFAYPILGYITVLFALATLSTACAIQNTEWDWIDNRSYPGGPISFSLIDGQDPIYLTMVMAFNLMSILQDGWLLHRFLIIWNRNWIVFTLPFLLYLASIATSLLIWSEILLTGAPFLSSSHIDIALINWVLTISTNIVLTALIILKILLARRAVATDVGPEHLAVYTSVASMLVESQSIYAIIGIVVLVGVKTNSQVVNALANTFGLMEAFAPTLVAYRVASGTAWTPQNQREEITTLKFARGGGHTTLAPSERYKSDTITSGDSPFGIEKEEFKSSGASGSGGSLSESNGIVEEKV